MKAKYLPQLGEGFATREKARNVLFSVWLVKEPPRSINVYGIKKRNSQTYLTVSVQLKFDHLRRFKGFKVPVKKIISFSCFIKRKNIQYKANL